VRPGHLIAASAIWQILHDAGTGPAPRGTGPTWKQFLNAQARGMMAADFVHAGTVLLRRIYALIVIEHGTRRAHLAGITARPAGAWTTQAARNFLMDIGRHADSARFLFRDRAGQFTESSGAVFAAAGIRILLSPPQAPKANAICERMTGTLRREVSGRLLIPGERHLRQVLAEYLQHYNTARPHRTLHQLAPAQADTRRRRPAWPGTGSAENKSSAASPASTSPPRNHPRLTTMRRSLSQSNIRAPQARQRARKSSGPRSQPGARHRSQAVPGAPGRARESLPKGTIGSHVGVR
jgi:putative transposase